MAARAMPLPTLAWAFLKIGALAIGDTGPVLAMIERDLVDGRRVLSREDVTDALTYTKPLPGSTVVQVVAYLAYQLGGWSGSALATVAYLLPSALAMLLFAAGYVAVTALGALQPALHGLTAAAVGVLLATAYRFAQRNIALGQPLTVALALAAFITGAVFGVSAALIVLIAGLVGAVLLTAPAAAGGGRKAPR